MTSVYANYMNCQNMVHYFVCLWGKIQLQTSVTLLCGFTFLRFCFHLKENWPLAAPIKGHHKSVYKTGNTSQPAIICMVQLSSPDGRLLKLMKSLPVSHHPLHLSLSLSGMTGFSENREVGTMSHPCESCALCSCVWMCARLGGHFMAIKELKWEKKKLTDHARIQN